MPLQLKIRALTVISFLKNILILVFFLMVSKTANNGQEFDLGHAMYGGVGVLVIAGEKLLMFLLP